MSFSERRRHFLSFSHPSDLELWQWKPTNTKEKHLTFCQRLSQGNLSPQGDKRKENKSKKQPEARIQREKLMQSHNYQWKAAAVPTPTSDVDYLLILLTGFRNH